MQTMKNSPSTTQRVLVEQETGSECLISTHAWLSLAKKAGKNDVPLSILEQVYVRGILEAKPCPKNSPEQLAFNRVDSFIHGGAAYELDKDLLGEMCVPDGKKHMKTIKRVINKYERKPLKENWGHALGSALRGALTSRTRKRTTTSSVDPHEKAVQKKLFNRSVSREVERRERDMGVGKPLKKTQDIERMKNKVRTAMAAGERTKGAPGLLQMRFAKKRAFQRSQENRSLADYVTKKVGITHDQYMGKGKKDGSLTRDQVTAVKTATDEFNKTQKKKRW